LPAIPFREVGVTFKPKTIKDMKKTMTALSLATITVLGSAQAQDSTKRHDKKMDHEMGKMTMSKEKPGDPNLAGWPEASRQAVAEITGKYGKPDGVTADELIWIQKGPWSKISITKGETRHSFPIEHTDMLETTMNYKVPEDKMDDLGKFDGSVTFDRTQGTLSARCDKEENNFLALNLSFDIIEGKKTVDQARMAYGDIVKEKMNGGKPAYMEKLTFAPKQNTGDPDKNTTGLTKEDVMKAVRKIGVK
jgi:hypothetical protein